MTRAQVPLCSPPPIGDMSIIRLSKIFTFNTQMSANACDCVFCIRIIKHWWVGSIKLKSLPYVLMKWDMHRISQSLTGEAYLAVKGWLCKLKQILRFIKHVLRVTRVWKHDIPFSICLLPPKSGLNRMSYPFISLSTVSFTSGILLGSLISLTLGRKKVV